MVSQILISCGLESHFLVNSGSTKLLSNSSFASQFSKKVETHECLARHTRLIQLDTWMKHMNYKIIFNKWQWNIWYIQPENMWYFYVHDLKNASALFWGNRNWPVVDGDSSHPFSYYFSLYLREKHLTAFCV